MYSKLLILALINLISFVNLIESNYTRARSSYYAENKITKTFECDKLRKDLRMEHLMLVFFF